MTVNLNPDVTVAGKEADEWVRRYYGLNFWGERWGPFGGPERVIERARQYAAAGADELVFRFASWDQPGQLGRFAATVLPALQSQSQEASLAV
jgi:alkanesulfonate monooxygenase SsuD/methylene tetrahydromethanopterin reductase-like flavin-dependent oxidoreductase (luciferase family)